MYLARQMFKVMFRGVVVGFVEALEREDAIAYLRDRGYIVDSAQTVRGEL